MLKTVKLNVLIPLSYDLADYSRVIDEALTLSEDLGKKSKHNSKHDCAEWFHYCFQSRPIEKNFQMVNSPLVTDGEYYISRFELNSDVRNQIGLNNNYTSTYRLYDEQISFRIGVIRFLFIKNGICFLHFALETSDINCDDARAFVSAFGQIINSHPRIVYNKKVSKNESENVQISLKRIVNSIINLQSYIPLKVYNNAIQPYIQINMVGSCDDSNKMAFFDSIQSMSPRKSSKDISETQLYRGKEEYISRFVGDRSFCIFGDTGICDEKNSSFLMDKNNGLLKTATENYTTVYAFLVSLRLLLNKTDLCVEEAEYVLKAPKRLSDEDNIREFYDQCLWEGRWNLGVLISELRERIGIKHIGKTILNMNEEIRAIKKIAEETHKDVGFMVGFIQNELKTYVENEKREFNASDDSDTDSGINRFINKTSYHINERIQYSGDAIIAQEEQNLKILFGNDWDYLMDTSKTSLISAGTLLKKCADINVPDFDYSGISICCTSALEAELRRVFFDGLINYMINNYGYPSDSETNSNIINWPDALLAKPRNHYAYGFKIKNSNAFTMGFLPYLFGETGRLSEIAEIRNEQLIQSRLMKSKMVEYLQSITRSQYKNNAYEEFYDETKYDDRITYKSGCFVWKCERIRVDYRNKAAHISVVTAREASLCYQSVLSELPTRSEAYVYNAEITGVILELFEKIDGSLISKSFHREYEIRNLVKHENTRSYNIGEIVELENLKVTPRGGLRGRIKHSSVSVTISPKSIEEYGLSAELFVEKVLHVRLIRWDDNAKVYNAEWIERG